ncbi:MAG: mannose-1-phosphate guanylyltransferase [Bacteroidales bacterium]|nr:mannose-1-phosphate guanylyltransferase [Bacteroidales bacterium]
MTNNNYYCVIMAGGLGDHLWPLSREKRPSQFIVTGNYGSSFQNSYRRCLGLVPKENILVVTLERFKEFVYEQAPDIPKENVLLEPISRHTAPCVVFATYTILHRNPDAVISMIPADQFITDTAAFEETLSGALDYAANHDSLMTIGVVPNRPDPNYGYIQVVGGKKARNSAKPVQVKTFTEKPILSIAQAFCKSNEFFWNTGIYIWKGSVIKEECEASIPDITSAFKDWEAGIGTPAEKSLLEKAYDDSIKLSIDYGVMEKTSRAWVFPAKFTWMDIDSWETVYKSIPGLDKNGNASIEEAAMMKDSSGCIVYSKNKNKLLAVRGLKDYLVIDTDDVLLICPKDEDLYMDLVSDTLFPDFEKYR